MTAGSGPVGGGAGAEGGRRLAADDPRGFPEAAFAVGLSALDGLDPSGLRELLAEDRPPDAWRRVVEGHLEDRQHRWRRSAARIDLNGLWQLHRTHRIAVSVLGDAGYPSALADDPEAPAVLFSRGDLTAVGSQPRVTLVGTRRATRYGLSVAAQLAGELTTAGVSVVSGLGSGIDGAAHEGACAAVDAGATGAPPVAVVASALDVDASVAHSGLFGRLVERGVVLSETPAGSPPALWRFAARHRILAALADVVVVVECHHQGGSLHTVRAAEERGITVAAVPGSVRSPASAGCNDLLADGCVVIRDAADILVALSLARAADLPVQASTAERGPDLRLTARPVPLAGVDQAVLVHLGAAPRSVEELMAGTGLSLAEVSRALEHLADAGTATGQGGFWRRTR